MAFFLVSHPHSFVFYLGKQMVIDIEIKDIWIWVDSRKEIQKDEEYALVFSLFTIIVTYLQFCFVDYLLLSRAAALQDDLKRLQEKDFDFQLQKNHRKFVHEEKSISNELILSSKTAKEHQFNKLKRGEIQKVTEPAKILIPQDDPIKLKLIQFAESAEIASCLNENDKKAIKLTDRFFVLSPIGNKNPYNELYFRGQNLIPAKFAINHRLTMPYHKDTGMIVDKQFYSEFLEGWKTLHKLIARKRPGRPEIGRYHYRLVGNGVGGLFALFTALRLWKLRSKRYADFYNIQVFTYGQPRIGNYQFADHVNSLMEEGKFEIYRVTNYNDPIPKMPITSHRSQWLHHGHEYWLGPISCDCDEGKDPTQQDLYACTAPKSSMGRLLESEVCENLM
ncbi:hypothetical protein G9A89_005379 [Geosiphon pyriformis]|nr:hypothetical protein G9A89_005379 [Geosiphon pyriformis]